MPSKRKFDEYVSSETERTISESEFRAKFKDLFNLDPDLSTDIIYITLVTTSFDVAKAASIIRAGRIPKKQFTLPSFLFRAPSNASSTLSQKALPSSTTLLKQSKSLQTKGKSRQNLTPSSAASSFSKGKPRIKPTSSIDWVAYRVIDNSDDDPEDHVSKRPRSGGSFESINSSFSVSTDSFKSQSQPSFKTNSNSIARRTKQTAGHRADDPIDLDISESEDEEEDSNPSFSFSSSHIYSDGSYDSDSSNSEVAVDLSGWVAKTLQPKIKSKTRITRRKTTGKSKKNPNEEVLQHRTTTLLTPWLFRLASQFYNDKVSEIANTGMRVDNSIEAPKVLYEDDRGVKWYVLDMLERIREEALGSDVQRAKAVGGPIWRDEEDDRVGFAGVTINGVEYRVGDFVLVRGIEDKPKSQQSKDFDISQGVPKGSPDIWFARIEHIYKDEFGDLKAHFQWFEHGSRTALGEFASAQETFMLTWCNDDSVECILKKISVSYLGRSSQANGESEGLGLVEQDIKKGQYFFRLHYDSNTEQYTDVPRGRLNPPRVKGGEAPECGCCAQKEEFAASGRDGEVRLFGKLEPGSQYSLSESGLQLKGFSYNKINYHVDDFVYIYEEGRLYIIAQITSISTRESSRKYRSPGSVIDKEKLSIKARVFERYDSFLPQWFEEAQKGQNFSKRDQRHLFQTQDYIKVPVSSLEGKCYVRHKQQIPNLPAWKDQKDTFWVEQTVKSGSGNTIYQDDLIDLMPDYLRCSVETRHELADKGHRELEFLERGPVFKALEIFSGAGGMTAGLKAAFKGKLEFVSSVEFSPAACHTHAQNFPECTVHCADASTLLERAIRRERGEKLELLLDEEGNGIEDLPRKGEIFLICGGPPCPGFSGMNRHKTADDVKNSLIAMFVAYLDFYRPVYFLLENVSPLLKHALGATRVDEGNGRNYKMEGGIQMGTYKMILRACTGLGYQVQQAVLQAAEHDVPQTRSRVFFWAAQPGWPLPEYPQLENDVSHTKNHTNAKWQRQTQRRGAPHHRVTVGEAITDLPAFDWIDVSEEQTPSRRREVEKRFARIPAYQIGSTELEKGFIGRNSQPYASNTPLSEFQRKMRDNIRGVCAIKMAPGADHLGLPDDLAFKPKFMWSTNKTAHEHNMYRGRYGRLDMEALFKTCCTTINPTDKPGTVVHPTQKRVLTIREYARAMSFPDSFVFDFDFCRIKDIIRQIGNGVPCNLAKAVGEELFGVLVEKFWREERKFEEVEANEKGVEMVLRGTKTGNKDVIEISDDDDSDADAEADDDEFLDIDDF